MNTKQTKNTSKQTTIKPNFAVGNVSFSAEAGIGLPISRGATSYRKEKYIPYSSNSHRYNTLNVFPQIIAQFSKESPTNRSAIKLKTMMTRGEGIDLSKVNANLRKLLNNLTEDGITIDDLLHKISRDYVIFGGFTLKVTWGNDGYIRYIEHIPFEYVRVGEPIMKRHKLQIPYYVVSNNWGNYKPTSLEFTSAYPAFNPNYFGKGSIPKNELGLPTPTEEQVSQSEQILYYYDDEPETIDGTNFYPIPYYAAALDAIATEIEMVKSSKSQIDNGFGGKTILTLPTLPATQEERDELEMRIKKQFTGAANNGGVMILFNNDPNLQVQVNQLQELNADTYSGVKRDTKDFIISEHNIPSILLNHNQGGGFNNRAQEMRESYNEFQQTIIKWYQQSILSILNKLVEYMGYNDKLEIIPFKLNPIVETPIESPSIPSKINSNGTSNNSNDNVSTQQETSLESN